MIGMNMINNCNAYSNYNHNVNFCGAKDKVIKTLPHYLSDAKTTEEAFAVWLREHKHLTDSASVRDMLKNNDWILVEDCSKIGIDPNTRKLGGFRANNGVSYSVCWEPQGTYRGIVNYGPNGPIYATFGYETAPNTLRRSAIMDKYNLG